MMRFRVYLEPVDLPYVDITADSTSDAIAATRELSDHDALQTVILRAALIEIIDTGAVIWERPDCDQAVTAVSEHPR